jgi:hypothetical protein
VDDVRHFFDSLFESFATFMFFFLFDDSITFNPSIQRLTIQHKKTGITDGNQNALTTTAPSKGEICLLQIKILLWAV